MEIATLPTEIIEQIPESVPTVAERLRELLASGMSPVHLCGHTGVGK